MSCRPADQASHSAPGAALVSCGRKSLRSGPAPRKATPSLRLDSPATDSASPIPRWVLDWISRHETSTGPRSTTVRTLVLPRLRPYQRALVNDRRRDVVCVAATQIGKTFAVASWLLAAAWRQPQPHVWWWTAPTYQQADIGRRLLLRLAQSAGILDMAVTTPTPRLGLINGASIEFRSWEREQNLHGATIAGGVIDEAGLLTPEAQAAISARRSHTAGPLRYIGNPGVVSGPFRRLAGLAESDSTGVYGWHRWTWRDKYAALLSERPAAAAEFAAFVESERRSIPDYEFRRLYEAVWTEDEAAVFRGVAECVVQRDALLSGGADEFALGVDVGQSSDYYVAVSYARNAQLLELRDRARGIGYPQIAERVASIARALHAVVALEINGPGVAVAQRMDEIGASYVPVTTTSASKQEMILRLASDIQERRVNVADHPPLPHELAIYQYRRMPTGVYQYSAPAGEHDDAVMAAALARWAAPRFDLSQSGWL